MKTKRVTAVRKQVIGNVTSSPPILALTIAGIFSAFSFVSSANAADVPRADLVNRKELRVCADPADLPFSNQKGEGFENKIADIIAEELKLPVKYTWFPKSMGFIRMTLAAKRCDLVIGWGQGDDVVLNTNAIYRSTSVLLYKKGTGLDGVETMSDPRLKGKRIGVEQGTPGGNVVAANGLMSNVRGYPMNVDRRYFNPAEDMINDIRKGDVDAGVLWGPIGAFWASRGGEPLVVVPLVNEKLGGKIAFRITMGVRNGDDAWKRQLNEIIRKRQGDIDKVLLDYSVPLLVDDDTSMELVTKPRTTASAEGSAAASTTAATPQPAAQAP